MEINEELRLEILDQLIDREKELSEKLKAHVFVYISGIIICLTIIFFSIMTKNYLFSLLSLLFILSIYGIVDEYIKDKRKHKNCTKAINGIHIAVMKEMGK